jgi:hypothetical protein
MTVLSLADPTARADPRAIVAFPPHEKVTVPPPAAFAAVSASRKAFSVQLAAVPLPTVCTVPEGATAVSLPGHDDGGSGAVSLPAVSASGTVSVDTGVSVDESVSVEVASPASSSPTGPSLDELPHPARTKRLAKTPPGRATRRIEDIAGPPRSASFVEHLDPNIVIVADLHRRAIAPVPELAGAGGLTSPV